MIVDASDKDVTHIGSAYRICMRASPQLSGTVRRLDGTGAPSAIRNIAVRDGPITAICRHPLNETDCPGDERSRAQHPIQLINTVGKWVLTRTSPVGRLGQLHGGENALFGDDCGGLPPPGPGVAFVVRWVGSHVRAGACCAGRRRWLSLAAAFAVAAPARKRSSEIGRIDGEVPGVLVS